jgi:hypothetical protein|tara:strand:+ start:49 stop:258 length:210 start_codon:yes stop_codon:yes gene_type:complete
VQPRTKWGVSLKRLYFHQITYNFTGYIVKSIATLTGGALLGFSYEKPITQVKTERFDWRDIWKYDKFIF